jgi:hypothetical protein
MRIDENILAQARAIDVLAFIEKRNGLTFTQKGGEYRCKEHPSLAIKSDRLSWFWHSKSVGGHGVLDYLTKVENMTFREAVDTVMSVRFIQSPQKPDSQNGQSVSPPKALVLPEKTGIPSRLYDYLCNKRGIDSEIVGILMNRDKLYEDRRGNVVFVGYDEHLKPRFASLKGTYGDCSFRGDCAGSDKKYGFNMVSYEPSDRLYLFESPIDLMSHASFEKAALRGWNEHNRLSLAGTTDTAMPFFLNQHRAVSKLVFCLDNDKAGQEASYTLARKYADIGYGVMIEPPIKKDFNEDLIVFKELLQLEKRTKSKNFER